MADALTPEELDAQASLARFTSLNVEGGEAAPAALLRAAPEPDAFLVASSLLATGSFHALLEAGRTVGEDVLFAAFDDALWTGLLGTILDVIRQPPAGRRRRPRRGRAAPRPTQDRDRPPQRIMLHPTLSFSR